jgi:hypothetical protein
MRLCGSLFYEMFFSYLSFSIIRTGSETIILDSQLRPASRFEARMPFPFLKFTMTRGWEGAVKEYAADRT